MSIYICRIHIKNEFIFLVRNDVNKYELNVDRVKIVGSSCRTVETL